ncbi:MAG: type II toxin-antitoxin system CcdA family antitoxin [Acidimicrobiales bacterium]
MARRNISLPDALDEQARSARLNVSALAQRAVADELDRLARMSQLDAWLDELDGKDGPPSSVEIAEAEAWAAARRSVRAATRDGLPRTDARSPEKGTRRAAS